TAAIGYFAAAIADFPTHVGVDRPRNGTRYGAGRFPHARGGGPKLDLCVVVLLGISPRTWGWTGQLRVLLVIVEDFPTHVGVDRLTRLPSCPQPPRRSPARRCAL